MLLWFNTRHPVYRTMSKISKYKKKYLMQLLHFNPNTLFIFDTFMVGLGKF